MKPTIVTSCWSAALPPDYAPIGISRGVPRRRSGYRRYRALEPGPWFASVTPAEFIRRYNEDVLSVLRAEDVVEQLLELAGGRIPALLCWEDPEPGPCWCHRALVSVWLQKRLGLEVPELFQEREGWGNAHPKLDPAERRRTHQLA